MHIYIFSAIAIICIGAASCADRNKDSNTLSSLTVDSTFVLSDIQLYTSSQDGSSALKKAVAYLRNRDSASPVYGGDLKINGTSVPARYGGHGATYFGIGDSGTAPIILDGSWHKFDLAGSSAYPAFIDSIRSPISATVISTPHSGDTISKASGISISWNANTTGGVSIMMLDTSRAIGHSYIDTTLTTDPGSISFSAAQLAPLATGPLTLTVTRGNTVYGVAGQHFRYRIGIGSALTLSLHLKP